MDPRISSFFLMLIGLGLLYSIHSRSTYFLYSLCALEIVGCVAHFLKIIPWIPQFSDTGYLIMSILDLIQSIFIYIINEKIH